MKITKSYLKQIIKEELNQLSEEEQEQDPKSQAVQAALQAAESLSVKESEKQKVKGCITRIENAIPNYKNTKDPAVQFLAEETIGRNLNTLLNFAKEGSREYNDILKALNMFSSNKQKTSTQLSSTPDMFNPVPEKPYSGPGSSYIEPISKPLSQAKL